MRVGNLIIDSPGDWRLEVTTATQRLLGDTIALSDRDWLAPTALPGWSRAHVATHLALHAKALGGMAGRIQATHEPLEWHTSHSDSDLNAGARRPALAIQEDLDQSSTTLMAVLDAMDDTAWETPVHTSQGDLNASFFIPDWLNQLIIHHIDLRLDYDFGGIDPTLVRTLLRWNLFRTAPRFAHVQLHIVSDEGLDLTVGQGRLATIRGNETSILAWITGRRDSSAILGAEGLELAGPV
ncbi:MAG: maleylpyruvate isomerase family mycothiol-dependent enzyme [Propionibacteriaceae bacterium]|nr:maleylpyruvate isomerase family mycothiol-dependent enzyme [Propionibacteriaceae bacterium]